MENMTIVGVPVCSKNIGALEFWVDVLGTEEEAPGGDPACGDNRELELWLDMLGAENTPIVGVPVCSNNNGETLLELCSKDEVYVSELLIPASPATNDSVCTETRVVDV